MQRPVQRAQQPPTPVHLLTTRVLRQWCSPEVIIAITDLCDEDTLRLHIINQARQSSAKVLLAHHAAPKEPPSIGRGRWPCTSTSFLGHSASEVLNRMANELRWAGVSCAPLNGSSILASEIPILARSHSADRVLVSAPLARTECDASPGALANMLLGRLDSPLCVVGRDRAEHLFEQRATRSITLLLLPDSCAEISLAFASRFAQERRSRLTVLYVFPSDEREARSIDRTPLNVAARLPSTILREAELLCPLEIAVREGEPASALLDFDAKSPQDFLIFALPQSASLSDRLRNSARCVIAHSRCPVLVLTEQPIERRRSPHRIEHWDAPCS